MKLHKILTLFSAIVLLSSCEKLLMEPTPKTDNLSIFDEYATLVKEKYAMLEFKGVDIVSLSDSIRNTINGELSEEELFNKLAIITKRLRDGHSSLTIDIADSESLSASFEISEDFPPGLAYSILSKNYLNRDLNSSIKTLGDTLTSQVFKAYWGTVPNNNDIGYLWIPSWNVTISDEEIETIFTDLKDTKGLIFDLRINGGGSPELATKFASYFMDKMVDTGFERFKIGPGPTDFSDSPAIIQPTSSANKYLKKTIVLTDVFCYSASTTFLYSVDPLETVQTMGQQSGGGSGSVADGYLSNGWHWSLSVSEFIDAKGRHLDDGVAPDIPVALDLTNRAIDEVIEAAILELQ